VVFPAIVKTGISVHQIANILITEFSLVKPQQYTNTQELKILGSYLNIIIQAKLLQLRPATPAEMLATLRKLFVEIQV